MWGKVLLDLGSCTHFSLNISCG